MIGQTTLPQTPLADLNERTSKCSSAAVIQYPAVPQLLIFIRYDHSHDHIWWSLWISDMTVHTQPNCWIWGLMNSDAGKVIKYGLNHRKRKNYMEETHQVTEKYGRKRFPIIERGVLNWLFRFFSPLIKVIGLGFSPKSFKLLKNKCTCTLSNYFHSLNCCLVLLAKLSYMIFKALFPLSDTVQYGLS